MLWKTVSYFVISWVSSFIAIIMVCFFMKPNMQNIWTIEPQWHLVNDQYTSLTQTLNWDPKMMILFPVPYSIEVWLVHFNILFFTLLVVTYALCYLCNVIFGSIYKIYKPVKMNTRECIIWCLQSNLKHELQLSKYVSSNLLCSIDVVWGRCPITWTSSF